MSVWLTIAWSRDELRLLKGTLYGAAGTARGRRRWEWHCVTALPVTLDQIDTPAFREQFAALISTERLQRAETVFLLPRPAVEVRTLAFPPVPAEELPEMVRFQAAREFAGYDANSALDFFLRDNSIASSQTQEKSFVIAAMAKPGLVGAVERLCQAAQLKLRRVVIQPCEPVHLLNGGNPNVVSGVESLMNGFHSDGAATTLCLEVDGDELQITCFLRRQPVVMRSQRLASLRSETTTGTAISEIAASEIAAEVKRTIIAVRNDFGADLDEIVVLGCEENTAPLMTALIASLSPTMASRLRAFDAGAVIAGDSEQSVEMLPGLVAFVGATVAAASDTPSLIDFLHPKRPPEPPSKRPVVTAVLAVTLAAVAVLLGWGFLRKTSTERQLTQLKSEIASISRRKPELTKVQQELALLDAWHANDIAWFEELEWLSQHLPPADAVMLSSMSMRTNKGEAVFTIPAVANNPDQVSTIEDKLTDAEHRAETSNLAEQPNNRQYPIRFQLTLVSHPANGASPPTGTPTTTPAPTEGRSP